MKLLIRFAKLVKKILPKRFHYRYDQLYRRADRILCAIPRFGKNFFCPCCGMFSFRFRSYGIKLRPYALCPNCDSLERHRLLWLYLTNKTNLFKDRLRVLHIAPEPVFEKTFGTLENLHYITADLNPVRAMVEMDITNIGFGNDWFDVVLCFHVLEHVPDDRKAMSELYRVLKPGGWAILQVPVNLEETYEDSRIITPEERERHFGQKDHVRVYGLDYKDRLEQAGFRVKVDNYINELGINKIKLYSLSNDENVYYCTKTSF